METPDQLLERLDKMGEERVRHLIASRYFKPHAVPLVNGWLSQKQEVREKVLNPNQGGEETLEKTRKLAREAIESAKKAEASAAKADQKIWNANRLALAAIAVGSGALVVSVLTLFVLAIR